jgi:hypothetical protein
MRRMIDTQVFSRTDMMFPRALIGLSFLLLASGCGASDEKTTAENADAFARQTNESVLLSPAFGLSIKPPKDWYALGSNELNDLMEMAADVASAGQDDLAAILDASQIKTYNLFAISRYETGFPVDENPNIMAVAENVSSSPGVKNGRDYFFHAKRLMAQATPNYKIEKGYKIRTIGGVDFDQMDLTIELAGILTRQSYYAAKHDDYMIVIIQSYYTEDGKELTSNVIDTIELDW